MSKSRSMGAGLSGSSRYGVNVNLNSGGGNKLQGLPPSHREFNKIPSRIFSKAQTPDRNVVINMNQLMGGVGRKKVNTAKSADGVNFSRGILDRRPNNRNRFIETKCLKKLSPMKIIGGKYVLNNLNKYMPAYGLGEGKYRIPNIPRTHPVALLNNGNTKISYKPVNEQPIIIKVRVGNTNPDANGDYYHFVMGPNDAPIGIVGGGPVTQLKFMRGRTYRFVADGIDPAHPFKLFVSGAFVDAAGISGTGTHTDLVIPPNHSTTPGDIYYECANHPAMHGNIMLSYGTANAGDNDADYDFVYGPMEITVTEPFGRVSLYCLNHGYMGGKYLLKYARFCKV